jgi:hypothetical protein
MRKVCQFAALCIISLGLTDIAVSQEQSATGASGTSTFFADCLSTPAEAHECAALERDLAPRLKQLGEPPLVTILDSGSISVYRLTLTTLTGPVPIRMARVTVKDSSSVEIIAKRKDFDDQVRTTSHILLSLGDARRLISLLQWENFKSIDPSVQSPIDPNGGTTHRARVAIKDGGTLFLEGAHGNEFHAIHRRAPSETASIDPGYGLMRDLFDYLNSMGAWNVSRSAR